LKISAVERTAQQSNEETDKGQPGGEIRRGQQGRGEEGMATMVFLFVTNHRDFIFSPHTLISMNWSITKADMSIKSSSCY
jgi:hypothetical protein